MLATFLVLITLYAQDYGRSDVALYLRVLNAFNSLILYLDKLFIPVFFAPHYPYFIEAGDAVTWRHFIPVLGVLGVTLASLFAWTKGRHAWLIAWLFYLVTLSPVLGLIQVGQQGAADRYAYFTTLPVYLLIGAGVLAVLSRIKPVKQVVVVLAIAPLVLFLADKTRQQIYIWATPQSLWSYSVEQFPEDLKARYNLAVAHLNAHEYQKALTHFDQSLQLKPDQIKSLAGRGMANLQLGNNDDALQDYLDVGKLAESLSDAQLDRNCIYFNSGWLYAHTGMLEESLVFFGRVDQTSTFGHRAQTWLNWLESAKHSDPHTPPREDLPGFCIEAFASSVKLINRE